MSQETVLSYQNLLRSATFPLELLLAMIEVESGGNSEAVRYEPHYRWLYQPEVYAAHQRITVATETALQRMSWGLFQVMGAVAREHGYAAALWHLTRPEVNVRMATRFLTWLAGRGYEGTDLIAAWNAGRPRRLSNGLYVNQDYVDRVLSAKERYATMV